MPKQLTLIQPDDWHLHLRDGDLLKTTVPDTAKRFARAIVMPNLKPAITTVAAAQAYRERILAAVPPGLHFEPLMTLYLQDSTPLDSLTAAKAAGLVGCKLYPAGATTHSAQGVTDLSKLMPLFAKMAELDLVLLIHGEVTTTEVDIFDREKRFIVESLQPLTARFPQLRIVLEHITTQDAVEFITTAPGRVAATITVHHLLLNRNDLLAGGLHPHFYCLPVLKRRRHQEALIQAATSGNPRFFLGTDSAPHAQEHKEHTCGCAGIYTAHAALELYAEVFEQAQALERLEGFASIHGPQFYGLPINTTRVRLVKDPWQVPPTLPFGNSALVPLRAGEMVGWRLIIS